MFKQLDFINKIFRLINSDLLIILFKVLLHYSIHMWLIVFEDLSEVLFTDHMFPAEQNKSTFLREHPLDWPVIVSQQKI